GHLLHAAESGDAASLAGLDAAAERTLPTAPQTAADLASRALELTAPGDPEALPRAVAAAAALAAAGRFDQADRVARDTLAKPLPSVAGVRLRCVLSAVRFARGEAWSAAAAARIALSVPGLPDGVRDEAMTACLRALACADGAAAGDLANRDPARLAEAAAGHPDPWARAAATEDLGLLLAERQEHDPAIRHLTAAVEGYLEVGAAADVARTRRSLRKLGVRHRDWTRPALRPVTGWESLTNAERTAAELVAQGLNNRQVAGQMYVSEHTVAFYLR